MRFNNTQEYKQHVAQYSEYVALSICEGDYEKAEGWALALNGDVMGPEFSDGSVMTQGIAQTSIEIIVNRLYKHLSRTQSIDHQKCDKVLSCLPWHDYISPQLEGTLSCIRDIRDVRVTSPVQPSNDAERIVLTDVDASADTSQVHTEPSQTFDLTTLVQSKESYDNPIDEDTIRVELPEEEEHRDWLWYYNKLGMCAGNMVDKADSADYNPDQYKQWLKEFHDTYSEGGDAGFDDELIELYDEKAKAIAKSLYEMYEQKPHELKKFQDIVSVDSRVADEFNNLANAYQEQQEVLRQQQEEYEKQKQEERNIDWLVLEYQNKDIKLPKGWNTTELMHECKDILCMMNHREKPMRESFLNGNANSKFFMMFFERCVDVLGDYETYVDPRGHHFVLVNDCLFGVDRKGTGAFTVDFNNVTEMYSADGGYYDWSTKKACPVKDMEWFQVIQMSEYKLYYYKLYWYNKNRERDSIVFNGGKSIAEVKSKYHLVFPDFMSGDSYWKVKPYERFMITEGADQMCGKRFALLMNEVCCCSENSFNTRGEVVNLTADFDCSVRYDNSGWVGDWTDIQTAQSNSAVMERIVNDMRQRQNKSKPQPQPQQPVNPAQQYVRTGNGSRGVMNVLGKIFGR